MTTFTDDVSATNPKLHLLYVEWACAHLRALQDCIKRLDSFSNLNLTSAIMALQREYEVLVTTNKAYNDAQRMLEAAGVKTWYRLPKPEQGVVEEAPMEVARE